MKKMIALGLSVLLLFAICAAFAEGGTESDVAQITGQIDGGAYVISLKVDPEDQGEWRADEMAQDDSVVKLAASGVENGVFTARYEPTGDGQVTVTLRHINAHNTCNELHTFDLLVRDGKVQEETGGSYLATSPDDVVDPYFSGKWLEKDTQFTELNVTKKDGDGWDVEIMSPVSHGAWLIRATVYQDCDYGGFVYADGVRYDLLPDGKPAEKEAAVGLWGKVEFTGTADDIQLVWYDMEMSENGETVTFERASEQ